MNLETLFSTNVIIPIIVAFIGFLIAVTTAVIAKEHKVSEFRQAWIDALREDLSKFYSINNHFVHIIVDANGDGANTITSFKENALRFNELSARVSLRLNWDEHEELIENIAKIDRYRSEVDVHEEDFTKLHSLLDEFMRLSKDILSTEWKVVKRGEKLFLKFKYISKILASTFMIAVYILFTIAMLKSPIFQW